MKISDCCGVPSDEDYGICSSCKEHCEFIEEDDIEKNDLLDNKGMIKSILKQHTLN